MITHPSPFLWASIAALLVIAAFNSWTSRINQFFFFSRTVPAGFAQTLGARAITKTYLRRVWFGFACAVLVLIAMVNSGSFSVFTCWVSAVVVQCLGSCTSFARAHRDTGKAIADGPVSATVEAIDDGAHEVISVPLLDPGAFTPRHMLLLFLAPASALVISAVAFFMAHMGWHQFFDAIDSNKADFLMGLGLGLIAGSVVLYVQLRYFSRHRSPMGRFTANGCVTLAWLGAATFALSTASVPLHLVITPHIKQWMLGAVLSVAILRLVYGWTRARLFPPPQVERNGDQFWRLGLFYYNPSDPTLFIQHRSGPGYTMNFANIMSWPLVLLIVADFAFLLFIHRHH